MSQPDKRDIVYLAALLHDIGKFSQRADENFDNSKFLSENSKGMLQYICKQTQSGYFGYLHVVYTLDFLEKKKEIFKQLGLAENDFKMDREPNDNFINLAAYHHNPKTELQAVIQLADWWSSGLERSKSHEYTDIHFGKERFKKQPLYSIFDSLEIGGKRNVIPHEIEIAELSINEKLFPKVYTESESLQPKYKALWDNFFNEFDRLPTDNLSCFSNSLFFLLKKYCWSIPSTTQKKDNPNVSLFDHLKITGAIASSLYDYQLEYPEAFIYNDKSLKLNEGHYPLQLVCVDISGIQSFIYSISSKFAAKSLKGRSFYLNILLESIQQILIEKAGTTLSHVIYASGGKFFMLLPNTEKVIKSINDAETLISEFLWNKYKGGLYVCIGAVAFRYEQNSKSENDIKLNISIRGKDAVSDLGDLWKEAILKASSKKQQKFSSRLLNNFNDIFEPSGKGGAENICHVTGEEFDDDFNKKVQIFDDENTELYSVTESVDEQKRIGSCLANHNWLTLRDTIITSDKNKFTILNKDWWIEPGFEKAARNSIIYKIVDDTINFLEEQSEKNQNSYGFRYYGGNKVVTDDYKDIKSFDKLTENKDGIMPKLAALRMDVDNLGTIFKEGFMPDEKSFSAYSTLSNQLDWFFSGYLNKIRNSDKFKDTVNIIYSGGDDLFAIGRWDKIIEFAEQIRNDFRKFTCRDDISISGGIEIFGRKFPIVRAAEMAGDAEDIAKAHKYEGSKGEEYDKDAVCLFGMPINWTHEWATVLEWKKNLVKWIDDNTITKGTLRQLFEWYDVYKKKYIDQGREDLSWKWHAAYSLSRRLESFREDENDKREAIQKLKQFMNKKIYDDRTRFEVSIVAARWTELLNRNKKIIENEKVD